MAVRYLTIEEVILLHHTEVGPSGGVRDTCMLESAIARPAHTAFGRDVHPTIAQKAAALLESLVMNHPFVDGNKRTGVLAAFVFLELNGRSAETDDDGLVGTVHESIAGRIDLAALAAEFERWIST